MRPVLTVEGMQLEVTSVSLRNGIPYFVIGLDENGYVKTYHDVSHTPDPVMNSTAIEMAKAFTYEDDRIEKIHKRIEAHEERMIELAFDYIQHDGPFAEKVESQKEWHRLNEQVVGLYQALEIVEGKHEVNTAERFAQGVVLAAVELAKATKHDMF